MPFFISDVLVLRAATALELTLCVVALAAALTSAVVKTVAYRAGVHARVAALSAGWRG
jgi:hypothetical protein